MSEAPALATCPFGRRNGGRAMAEMLKLAGAGPMFGMGGFQLLPSTMRWGSWASGTI